MSVRIIDLMNTLVNYVICFLSFGIVFTILMLLKKYNKVKLAFPILGGVLLALVFMTSFFIQGIMQTRSIGETGVISTTSGNYNLIGDPYGDNRFLNLLALLSIWLFYPIATLTGLLALYPFKDGKLFLRYIGFPILAILSAALILLQNALLGIDTLSFKSILLSVTVGVSSALALYNVIDNRKEAIAPKKDIPGIITLFITLIIAFVPCYFLTTLINTDFLLFGRNEIDVRVYDFSLVHRIYIYSGLIWYFLLFYTNLNTEINRRRAVLICVSFGAILSYFVYFGYDLLFYFKDGVISGLNINKLPIHLCNAALFILPICTLFKAKKLFYFTYFINVFGAMMAMIFPNVGEHINAIDPYVIEFWMIHVHALMMPLLCVSLGLFERPKFKSILWSILFLFIYYVLVLFLNAWLSNYISGYNPNVFGTGTDFFFTNNDYILDIMFDDLTIAKIVSIRLVWTYNNLTFVLYPAYQIAFFVSYVVIVFIMWYVYALFYLIEDKHLEALAKAQIAHDLKIDFKKRMEMKNMDLANDNNKTKIEFVGFSKKYHSNSFYSVKDVNLEVNEGKIFGFLGPNGAGKSTCIKSLVGIQPPTEGELYICGHDVIHESTLCKKLIGYVPDHYALYERLTAKEYISYIADIYGVSVKDRNERMEKYAKMFDLEEAFNQQIQTYSHGMKQKVSLIASLIHDPKVWILDEPLSGLDPQSIYKVKMCMKERAEQGNIVFFSSHVIDVVEKLCDEIAIISNGKIVYKGDVKSIENLEEFFMEKTK